MRSQLALVVESLIGGGIDNPDCASLLVPVGNVQSLLCRIIAKVIHVIAKVDGGDQIEGGSIVDVKPSLIASNE